MTPLPQIELERLTKREREIFTELIAMDVQDDDRDLNDVHRTLIKWYRLDMRHNEIEKQMAEAS